MIQISNLAGTAASDVAAVRQVRSRTPEELTHLLQSGAPGQPS